MALASDNKEPESQLARSEIYFIEVLPPEGNSTEADGGDMEGNPKRFRFVILSIKSRKSFAPLMMPY